ncbi:MAG: SAM-dependent methyltransferase [Thermoplasmatota archaeon]
MLDHLLAATRPDACTTGLLYSHPMVEVVLGGALHPGGPELTLELAQRARLGPDDHVLDVGCGKGGSAILLAKETGCRVTGWDVSPDAVAAAKAAAAAAGLAERVTFEVLPDGALPPGAGAFDAVLSECTLCLLGDQATTLSALHDHLRPGGRLLLSDVTVEDGAPGEAFRNAAGFVACLGGAGPDALLQDAVAAAGFDLTWHDNRPALLAALRDRIRSRVNVEAILDALGAPAAPLRGLVATSERALDEGQLGYACLVATRREA